MTKFSEPFWLFELKYHLWRRFRNPKYRSVRRFRRQMRHARPGGLMIDCGANVGDVTALFLEKGYTVHAFEPDPDARAVLLRRFGGHANLTVHEQAVGARPGRAVLFRKPQAGADEMNATQSSSLVQRDLHGDGGVEVEVIDLAAFIEGLDRKVDVVKLDVEGVEVDILEAMLDRRFDRKVGQMLVETHERFSSELAARTAAIRRRVKELGIGNVDLDWI